MVATGDDEQEASIDENFTMGSDSSDNGEKPRNPNDRHQHNPFNNRARREANHANEEDSSVGDDEEQPHERRYHYAQPHHRHRQPMKVHDLDYPRGCDPRHRAIQNNNAREPSEASVRYHRNRQEDEEKFAKLKFQMPKFKSEEDPNAYIDWELKVEKIFRIHNYPEESIS